MSIVMKFGGTSVKDANMIDKTTKIIISNITKKPIVVLSAVSGTTDLLIKSIEDIDNQAKYFNQIEKTHKQILKELNFDEKLLELEFTELKGFLVTKPNNTNKDRDYVSFFGERLSTKIVAKYLEQKGYPARPLISGDIGLITNDNYTDAEILETSYDEIKEHLSKVKEIPVITGFGGKDKNGYFTTFSRGGSDYVASLIGKAIMAKEIQIWTDVNGILTADPRIIPNSQKIEKVSFEEAAELAYFGAKVLHPKTIRPAIKMEIPVKILNTFEPQNTGTTIVKGNQGSNFIALTSKKNITIIQVQSVRMLEVHGFVLRIFQVFNKYKVSVDMITTSEINVSITIEDVGHLDEIVKELEEFSRVKVFKDNTILCLVGRKGKSIQHHLSEIFEVLHKQNIDVKMISQSTNEISVGVVISQQDTKRALEVLHKKLIC